ncbi:MAG: hypothetical protein WEE67_00315 [Chloroflexota bacterium]
MPSPKHGSKAISLVAIRAAVESKLGTVLSDRIWEFMVERRFVADMPDQTDDDIAYVVAVARDLIRISADRRAATPAQRRGDREEMWQALTSLIAADAAAHDDVVALRAEIGGVMPWDRVEGWIRWSAARDRKALQGAELAGELAYGIPSDDRVHRVRYRHGGTLARLQDVARGLELAYGWQDALAVVYVLTGIPPAYTPLEADREIHYASGYAAMDRIVLRIDPTLPASAVAAFYRRVRGPARRRALSARQARLAAFVVQRPSEPWDVRRRAWNALHPPAWRYGHVSNMIRDAGLARDRLLRPRPIRSESAVADS